MSAPTVTRDSHALATVLVFTHKGTDLEFIQCTCGRIFDDARFAAHLEREAGL
jgi:hypothetical protein